MSPDSILATCTFCHHSWPAHQASVQLIKSRKITWNFYPTVCLSSDGVFENCTFSYYFSPTGTNPQAPPKNSVPTRIFCWASCLIVIAEQCRLWRHLQVWCGFPIMSLNKSANFMPPNGGIIYCKPILIRRAVDKDLFIIYLFSKCLFQGQLQFPFMCCC